jgi:hypothetical protein
VTRVAAPRRHRCRRERNASIRSRVPPCAGCARTARPPPDDQPDGIDDGRALLPRRTPASLPEISIEGVAKSIAQPSAIIARATCGRPNRAAGRLLEHGGELDADAKLVQSCTMRSARVRRISRKRGERRLQLARVGKMESEDVRLDVAFHRAQLDAGDDAHAELPRRASRSRCRDGVVIGQRDRRQSDALRARRRLGRRTRSVGRGGVDVEIDESARRSAA